MNRQTKVDIVSTQAISDMKGKSLPQLFQLIKPETDSMNRFYNSIVHNVIHAIQEVIGTDYLITR